MTKAEQEVPKSSIKLLIDTNIYLDFYRSNKDSIQLLSELSKHFDKIILTDQIIQEFERNREVVIQTMKKSFESESNLQYVSSAYLQNLPEFTVLLTTLKEYQNQRKEVVAAIDTILESPEKDPIYSFFVDMIRESRKNNTLLDTTDEIISKAHKRKLTGNPPTSSGFSIGDEINWEIVLANVKENIIIIGRDNTFTNNFSFLKRDFHLRTGHLILKQTNSITGALKEIGIATSAELEVVEKNMLEELKTNEFWKHQPKDENTTSS
ncbi:MAG: PIN domain-containing protein [Chryseobacterium sp.]|uniref:PIN domain-containing protein n=1 Tax=Chryseobacterium sp. TaxID=1871047 RepID=UPI003D12E389